jgi:Icc-related predicted phosphoesterase
MRILATADIHGVLNVYDWLVEVVERHQADLLLIAGDLFAADWEDGQREQARQIIPVLKSVAVPCFYITDVLNGKEFGNSGVYERITGWVTTIMSAWTMKMNR